GKWSWFVLEATMISSLVPWLVPLSSSTCNVLTVLLQGATAWFAYTDLLKDSMFRDKQNRKTGLRFLPCLSDTLRYSQSETCPLLCHCGDQLGEQGRQL
ncbi:hypothetical protein EDB89DRAFT_2017986, partial [Lactarius sanguifluus]